VALWIIQLLGSVLAHRLGLFAVYVQIMMRQVHIPDRRQAEVTFFISRPSLHILLKMSIPLHDPCIGPMHLPSLQAWQSDWITLHVGILLNTIKAFLNACAFAIHVHKANWPQNHQTNNPL
jgi:hypothetical protein